MQQLPRTLDADTERRRNFRMVAVARFLQDEDRALFGRQRFEQDEKCQRHRLRTLNGFIRRFTVGGQHRFGKPWTDIFLPRCTSGLQTIETETREDRDRKRFWRADGCRVGARVAHPGILHDVFRVRCAAEHPIRNRKQQRPVAVEELCRRHFMPPAKTSWQTLHVTSDSAVAIATRPAPSRWRAATGSKACVPDKDSSAGTTTPGSGAALERRWPPP